MQLQTHFFIALLQKGWPYNGGMTAVNISDRDVHVVPY
jgi:hypothetical protein